MFEFIINMNKLYERRRSWNFLDVGLISFWVGCNQEHLLEKWEIEILTYIKNVKNIKKKWNNYERKYCYHIGLLCTKQIVELNNTVKF